jgi:hypothetical protein
LTHTCAFQPNPENLLDCIELNPGYLQEVLPVPDYRSTTTIEDVFNFLALLDGVSQRIYHHGHPTRRKIRNQRPFVRYSGQTKFSASGNTSVDAWYSDFGQTLNTKGEVVDSLKVVGSEPKYGKSVSESTNGDSEPIRLLYNWIQGCQKLAADTEGGMTEARFEQFWRTMTCGSLQKHFLHHLCMVVTL